MAALKDSRDLAKAEAEAALTTAEHRIISVAAELPIKLGDYGDAVADVKQRLALAGCDVGDDEPQEFTKLTREAVFLFQASENLSETGEVDHPTWSALIEASRSLGDRPLYLRHPMLRGQDVVDLQHTLGKLGFDAGRADGFFGPETSTALITFQQNMALVDDGICGPATLSTLLRVANRAGDESIASFKERERLRKLPRNLSEHKIIIGDPGGLGVLTQAIHRNLRRHNSKCSVLQHPNAVLQARQANQLQAELYIGFEVLEQPICNACYFQTDKFTSQGGKSFAEIVVAPVADILGVPNFAATGSRLPILQKTKMPAIWLYLGPPPVVVQYIAEIAEAILTGVKQWIADPI